MYYHSTRSLGRIFTEMQPTGYYEKAGIDGDCPRPLFDDIGAGFPMSKIPELSFSMSIEGSILGGVKSQCEINEDCMIDIYSTEEEPDIDLSDCPWDFSILEEVRYRRTIPVEKIRTITVKGSLVTQINENYGLETEDGQTYIAEESLMCEKEDVKKQLEMGKTVLEPMDKGELEECWAKMMGVTVEELREYNRESLNW